MYYLIEITNYNNSTPTAKGIYSHNTLDAATAAFHQKMAGAINNATYASELCMIIDEIGAVQRYEFWARSAAEA